MIFYSFVVHHLIASQNKIGNEGGKKMVRLSFVLFCIFQYGGYHHVISENEKKTRQTSSSSKHAVCVRSSSFEAVSSSMHACVCV